MFQRRRPLSIQFIEPEDVEGGGTEESVDASAAPDPSTRVDAPAPESGINPNWAALQEKLDPISFRNIQDDLKKMDAAANQRITSSNEALKPWKAFAEQGLNPQQIQQQLAIVKELNENPEKIYEALGTFLKDNGRLPNKQELKAEVAENAEDPEGEEEDPRFAALEQQQQQIADFIQAQAQAEVARQADAELDKEATALRAKYPDLSDADMQEVYQRSALIAERTKKTVTLEQGYADFAALRDRLISSPRPGASAPRLLPTNGGIPTQQPQKTLGSLSRTETQNLIADLLEKNRS